MKFPYLLLLSVALFTIFPNLNNERVALAAVDEDFKVTGYITWSNLNRNWGGGANLTSEPSLKYLTHIVGPEVILNSTSNPTLEGRHGDLRIFNNISEAAHANGLKTLAWLYGSADDLTDIISNGKLDILVDSIRDLVVNYNLDGIELDFEPAVGAYQASNDTLIDALYIILQPLGKSISITGGPGNSGPNIKVATAQKIDFIDVMCYDMSGKADMEPNGFPHASYIDTIDVMQRWINWGFPPGKLVMGIPFYGRDTSWRAYSYADIVDALNPTADQDLGTISGIKVWWNSINTVKTKVDWALQNLGGVMVFNLGHDKLNDPRSLLKNIYDEIARVDHIPPKIATNAAIEVTAVGATLKGNLIDEGTASEVEVSFEYGLTKEYGAIATGLPSKLNSIGTFSSGLTGLIPNTEYHYRARATGAGTAYGSDQTFTTLSALPLLVTSNFLNKGKVGITYSQTLATFGGIAPYVWSVISGSLPEGLTLSSSGVISGTPKTDDTYNFTIMVTDSLGVTATRTMSITVDNGSLCDRIAWFMWCQFKQMVLQIARLFTCVVNYRLNNDTLTFKSNHMEQFNLDY